MNDCKGNPAEFGIHLFEEYPGGSDPFESTFPMGKGSRKIGGESKSPPERWIPNSAGLPF